MAQKDINTEDFVMGEVSHTDTISDAISNTALCAGTADGVTELILQGHLKQLCEMQRQLLSGCDSAGIGSDEKVFLRAEVRDGKKMVVDQNGRELAGLQSVRSEYRLNDFDRLCIEIVEHDENGETILQGGHR